MFRAQRNVLSVLVLLLLPAAAHADRVTVKGTVLEGKVKSITSKAVVMETVYGKGDLVIDPKDVEKIETDVAFHVFHGDDVDSVGPVVGVTPDAISVQPAAGEPESIAFSDVYVTRRDPGPEGSFLDRLAIDLAYWEGNLDFGFSYINATADSSALASTLGLRRNRGPSRLRFDVSHFHSTNKSRDESRETTSDEVSGQIRLEHDIFPRTFVFGSQYAEYDGVENVSIRSISRAGFGYRVLETESAWISVDGGPGYVYERYFGGDSNDYPTIGLGAESDWKLPLLGATWHSRFDYTPSLLSGSDYLLRGETSLLVPLISRVSFKASLVNLYNNSPADDTEKNNLATLVGLSLGF